MAGYRPGYDERFGYPVKLHNSLMNVTFEGYYLGPGPEPEPIGPVYYFVSNDSQLLARVGREFHLPNIREVQLGFEDLESAQFIDPPTGRPYNEVQVDERGYKFFSPDFPEGFYLVEMLQKAAEANHFPLYRISVDLFEFPGARVKVEAVTEPGSLSYIILMNELKRLGIWWGHDGLRVILNQYPYVTELQRETLNKAGYKVRQFERLLLPEEIKSDEPGADYESFEAVYSPAGVPVQTHDSTGEPLSLERQWAYAWVDYLRRKLRKK